MDCAGKQGGLQLARVTRLAWMWAVLLLGLAACQTGTPTVATVSEPVAAAPAATTGLAPGELHHLVVSPRGQARACTAAIPCSLETANASAGPGDTVLLLAGEYTVTVKPARDGEADRPIIYQSDGQAVLRNQETCAVLDQRSWIVLRQLRFIDCGSSWIAASHVQHITVEDCEFNSSRRGAYSGVFFLDAAYVTLAGNRFGQWGENALVGDSAGFGDAVRLERVDYVLLENNDFSAARAGHALVNLRGRFGVLRGNRFQNPWQKDVELTGTGLDDQGDTIEAGPYLVEANRFEYAGYSVYTRTAEGYADVAKGGVGLQSSASTSIFRGNLFANNQVSGLAAAVMEWDQGFAGNYIYHNTFYGHPAGPGIRLTSHTPQARMEGNRLVNNLFVDNGFQENPDVYYSYQNPYSRHDRPRAGLQIMFDFAGEHLLADNRLAGNLFYQSHPGLASLVAVNGIGDADIQQWQAQNPVNNSFVGNRVVDPRLDLAGESYRLLPGSPAIDSGAHLTYAVLAGDHALDLPVEDAGFFSTGWGLVAADWIRVGGGTPVQISGINAAANRLTLSEPRSWRSGDPVDLYRDSCGQVMLFGTAPDPGANEFGVSLPEMDRACR